MFACLPKYVFFTVENWKMAEGNINEDLGDRQSSSGSLFSGICKVYPDRKTKYGVKVTESDIYFNKIAETKKKDISLRVVDIVGCEITAQGDQKRLSDIDEHSSCVTIYAYERRSSKSKVVTGRKRRTVTLLFDTKTSYGENREDAVMFKEKVQNISCPSGCKAWKENKVLVLVNPKSGPGKALSIFQERVVPMLAEAGVQFNLIITQKAGHAYEMMKKLDLTKWYGILIVSGDGLIYEVINGLQHHSDHEKALKMPIGCLPGGTGNALCAAICHYAGESVLDSIVTNATYVLLKHQILPLDFVAVEMQNGRKLWSFLSVTWGLMADVDIESEKYRFMGPARLTLGTIIRTVNLRKYRGRLSFMPVEPYHGPLAKNKFRRSESQYPTSTSMDDDRYVTLKKATSLVDQPYQENGGTISTENGVGFGLDNSQNSFEGGSLDGGETINMPPLTEPVPSDWVTLEREFVTVGIVYLSHLATDFIVRGDRNLTEGTMDLVIMNHTISRSKIMKTLIELADGSVQESADVERVRITAFRLEPLGEKGIIAVDGERVEYGAIQGKIVHGKGRVMAKEK